MNKTPSCHDHVQIFNPITTGDLMIIATDRFISWQNNQYARYHNCFPCYQPKPNTIITPRGSGWQTCLVTFSLA